MTQTTRLVLLSLVLACPAMAGALDRSQVGADARWLMYFDIEGIRADPTVQQLRDGRPQHPEPDARLEKVKQWMGIESWEDISSVLFYGTNYEKGEGVMVIEAAADEATAVRGLVDKPNYIAEPNDSHTIHSWTYETRRHGTVKEHRVYIRFYPGNQVVLARHRDQFNAAIAVLDGDMPSLMKAGASLRGAMPVESNVYIEAAGPATAADKHGAWLKRMHHLAFAIVHGEETLTLKLTIDAGDEEAAKNLHKMGEGFLAMLKLRYGETGGENNKGASRVLLDEMRMKMDGSVLRMDWSVPRSDVMRMMEEHMKKHRHRHGMTGGAE